jgi:hypothetical protein
MYTDLTEDELQWISGGSAQGEIVAGAITAAGAAALALATLFAPPVGLAAAYLTGFGLAAGITAGGVAIGDGWADLSGGADGGTDGGAS